VLTTQIALPSVAAELCLSNIYTDHELLAINCPHARDSQIDHTEVSLLEESYSNNSHTMLRHNIFALLLCTRIQSEFIPEPQSFNVCRYTYSYNHTANKNTRLQLVGTASSHHFLQDVCSFFQPTIYFINLSTLLALQDRISGWKNKGSG